MRLTDNLSTYLSQRGMKYVDYLNSAHWINFRTRYRLSYMPQSCLACEKTLVQLHHITYERLGCEKLGDVIPLCDLHHEAIHAFDDETRGRGTLFDAFVQKFGLSLSFAISVLLPFNVTRVAPRKKRESKRKIRVRTPRPKRKPRAKSEGQIRHEAEMERVRLSKAKRKEEVDAARAANEKADKAYSVIKRAEKAERKKAAHVLKEAASERAKFIDIRTIDTSTIKGQLKLMRVLKAQQRQESPPSS